MLAARDQENLTHGHHAAAAAKPLNQTVKGLAPKTPGNKGQKTPFKLPLNDENGPPVFGAGKPSLKINGKGGDNTTTGGKGKGLVDRNAFVTPLAPRNRAPLGQKTTNVKAQAFKTPAPSQQGDDIEKIQKSATARKSKARVSHAEMTKVEVFGDKDNLEERDIEYGPPRPPDMDNKPDDLPDIDLSIFENGGLTRNCLSYYMYKPGPDGLSYVEREKQAREARWKQIDLEDEAETTRAIESQSFPCIHMENECLGETCSAVVEARLKAEETYQTTIASIRGKALPNEPALKTSTRPSTKILQNKKSQPLTKGPSTLSSKSAANVLASHPKPRPSSKTSLSTKPISTGKAFAPSRKTKTPPPMNPSPMRHTAAAAASRTTMGYSKVRNTSATLRETVLPSHPKKTAGEHERPDTSLPPAIYVQRYGNPPFGSELYRRCRLFGCLQPEEGDEAIELDEGEEGKAATTTRDQELETGKRFTRAAEAAREWFREQDEAEFVFT